MTITYRTTGAWGAGKGANLTPAEVDTNFHTLDQRVTAVETNPVEPVQIESITSSGSALTITMDNGDVYGPLALPSAAFVFRGDWAPSTAYTRNDIVVNGFTVYAIAVSHTSDATFNASRTISGVSVYRVMIDVMEPATYATQEVLLGGTHTGIGFTTNTDGTVNATVDFTEGTEAYLDAVGSAINIGSQSGISVVYDDANNKFDFNVTVTQYTDELAQDAIASALAAGTHSGISFSYNDAGNAISATSDVPADYSSNSGKIVAVKNDGSGLEFVSPNALVPVAAVPRFMGAQVYLSASTTAQNYSTATAIAFGAEAYDTDGFHDNVTNNTRLTIPAGLGIKKVRVAAVARVSSITAGSDNVLTISKNGAYTYIGNPGTTHENSAATTSQISISSGPIAVADGDYFEFVFQTSDTSTGLDADRTSFSIEVVEVEGGVNIANVQADATTARTLGMADINAHLVFSSSSAVTVTVPANATTAFPVGATIDIEQNGTGQVSISGAAGVTVNKPAARTAATAARYSVVRLRKVATNTWTLFGDLA